MDRLHEGGAGKEGFAMRDSFDGEDIAAFEPSEKIALVATLNEAGEPHVSLLSTLTALGPDSLGLGEFSRGLSKEFMRKRPKVGFLAMSLDRRLWRGRAIWRRSAKEGPEYVKYNRQPLFRYNTYFGINTVHYLDLAGVEGPSPLPLGGIALASLATALMRGRARPGSGAAVLPPFAVGILDAPASLNFLAFVDAEGFPRLVPALQARSAGPSRIVFSPGPWRSEIRSITEGAGTALFSMNLGMESFLARGSFSSAIGGGLSGIDLDFLYDSAPPCHGQVYPPRALAALVEE
jgi:hypothetical protein